MLGLAAVPAIIQLLLMVFLLPETPHFLMERYGADEEAIEIVRK